MQLEHLYKSNSSPRSQRLIKGIFLNIIMSKQVLQNFQSISGISNIDPEYQSSMFNDDSHNDIEYKIKINAPHGHLHSNSHQQTKNDAPVAEVEPKHLTSKIPYVADTTGYDNNRQLYSQEDIREAFHIIDINKDGALTVEDLSFFLDCMNEEYTLEEVKEMIRMVSSDGQKVLVDDFKKIGKGRIIPFAGIKMPDQHTKQKQTILNNLKDQNLTLFDPSELSQQEDSLMISYDRFQQEKARKNDKHSQDEEQQIEEDENVLRLRTSQELQAKKNHFLQHKITMLNIEKAIENFKNCKSEYIDGRQIAEILSISQNQAKLLFLDNGKKINARSVILDAILFSPKLPIKKLELIMLNMSRSQTLKFDEWLQVLIYMRGSDQRDFIRKRLLSLLKSKRLNATFDYDKYYILQIMSEQLSLFIW